MQEHIRLVHLGCGGGWKGRGQGCQAGFCFNPHLHTLLLPDPAGGRLKTGQVMAGRTSTTELDSGMDSLTMGCPA